jgi:ParB-like chromosome segregation protein Spo0J
MSESPLRIEYVPRASLTPYAGNARTHSADQVAQLAAAIRAFGWTNPILVDEASNIIAGHGRLAAATELGLAEVPVIRLEGLTDSQRRALAIADNKLALNAGWDQELLVSELQGLGELQGLVGFSEHELLRLMRPGSPGLTDPDSIPALPSNVVTQPGDIWTLDRHTLVCGDSTDHRVWAALPGNIALVLTDPPYGLDLEYADAQHDDTEQEVARLAKLWLPIARERAAAVVFTPGVTRQWLYPVPSWVMCWFYGGGQFRSSWGFNCWQPILCYGTDPSLASGHGCRPDALDLNTPACADNLGHPCPKPVALWEKLIERLAFKPSVIVDCFGGAGTTLIACETLGHTAALIELSPRYCDIAVTRWENFTGRKAERIAYAAVA